MNNTFAAFCKKHERLLWLMLMLLGAVLRLAFLNRWPVGFNQDEASIGYDAWSLLHFGIDRNGNSWPALLVAWGSGQNALYAYLLQPIIAVFGLGVTAVRLPAALLGTLTLALWYALLRRTHGVAAAVTGLALLAVTPWHIMVSRWGLESNILPFFLILGIYCLVLAMQKPWFFVGAAASFALCLYAYGTAFLLLPPFLLCALLYLRKKKALQPLPVLVAVGVLVLLSLPIVLTNCINLFGWGTIQLGPVTLPKLTEARQQDTMSYKVWENARYLVQILLRQDDGLPHNTLPGGMIFVPFTYTLATIGTLATLRGLKREGVQKDKGDALVLMMLACAVVCALFIQVNITRINFLFLPLLYMACVGLTTVIEKAPGLLYNGKGVVSQKICAILAALLLTASLGIFGVRYLGKEHTAEMTAVDNPGLGAAIQHAEALQEERAGEVVLTERINMAYIYVLFYTQTPTDEFLATVSYHDANADFRRVESFGHYRFYWDGSETEAGAMYILRDTGDNSEGLEHLARFGEFVVAVAPA